MEEVEWAKTTLTENGFQDNEADVKMKVQEIN